MRADMVRRFVVTSKTPVSAQQVADRFGIKRPSAAAYLRELVRAGGLIAVRVGSKVFYK